MRIIQDKCISDCRSIMTRKNCQNTMPFGRRIFKWFDSKSQRRRRYLGKVDFRCDRDKRHPTAQNNHRCHTFGLAIVRQCFIWAIKNSDWRPSKMTLFDLLNKVINYQGNFVICHSRFNIQWRDGGQRTLLNILQNCSEEGIIIPEQQVSQLLRVLHAIRKRYYKNFFKKCKTYGVSQDAIQIIKFLLQQIYGQAKKVKGRMNS